MLALDVPVLSICTTAPVLAALEPDSVKLAMLPVNAVEVEDTVKPLPLVNAFAVIVKGFSVPAVEKSHCCAKFRLSIVLVPVAAVNPETELDPAPQDCHASNAPPPVSEVRQYSSVAVP